MYNDPYVICDSDDLSFTITDVYVREYVTDIQYNLQTISGKIRGCDSFSHRMLYDGYKQLTDGNIDKIMDAMAYSIFAHERRIGIL